MSFYGSSGGGREGSLRGNRDYRENRDNRDNRSNRDRVYYPRYNGTQKRFGASAYLEQPASSNYNRQDSRDFHGYQRSNFSQAASGLGTSRNRGRGGEAYDSYQGSKYRPQLGNSNSYPFNQYNEGGPYYRNEEERRRDTYKQRTHRPPRDQYKPEKSERDRGEEKGGEASRKNSKTEELDQMLKRRKSETSERETRRSFDKGTESEHKDVKRSGSGDVASRRPSGELHQSKVDESGNRGRHKPVEEDCRGLQGETNAQRNEKPPQESDSKPDNRSAQVESKFHESKQRVDQEPESKLTDPEKEGPKSTQAPHQTLHSEAKESVESGDKLDAVAKNKQVVDSASRNSESANPERDEHSEENLEGTTVKSEDAPKVEQEDSSVSKSQEEDAVKSPRLPLARSPPPFTADSSVLSPVNSVNSSFANELKAIVEDDPEISEAETVISASSPSTDKIRGYLRTTKAERSRAKRNVIPDSDDEDHERYSKSVTATPEYDGDKKRTPPKYKMKRDSTGRSLLQRACKKGDIEEVKKHIARGADANESDFGGFTCLHEAALAGHTEIVKYLISHGANVNCQANEVGDLETPLMDAAENKHIDTIKVLLENGADRDIVNANGFSALTKIYHTQADDDDDYSEVIALLATSGSGNDSELQLSFKPGEIIADPHESFFAELLKKKSSPMIYKYVAQGLKEAVAEDFLSQGYTLLSMPNILILAARNGSTELVDILLGLNPGKFNIDQKNEVGVTALLASVGRVNFDVVNFLLGRGADPLVKRSLDGLNAIEVAKHSAQCDPREVLLLNKYASGKMPEREKVARRLSDAPAVPNKIRKVDQSSLETGHARKSKAELQDEMNDYFQPRESKVSEKPRSDTSQESKSRNAHERDRTPEAKTPERKDSNARLPSFEFSSPKREALAREDPKTEDMHQRKLSQSTPENPNGPLSPPPLTKAQEEQRIKAVEEAKMWQEKVLAKKKARKELFLQAEKEKERKRKEEEDKKAAELLAAERMKKEKQAKAVQDAKRLVVELEEKRQAMEVYLIRQKYPIGLQEAQFNGPLSASQLERYLPLYVFERDSVNHVLDLQVALILGMPVSDLHARCGEGMPLTKVQKKNVWPIFQPMLGVNRDFQIDPAGMEKFSNLMVRYIKLETVRALVAAEYPQLVDAIWNKQRLTNVDLEESVAHADLNLDNGTLAARQFFVPPKWKHRGDVLRVIETAGTPMW